MGDSDLGRTSEPITAGEPATDASVVALVDSRLLCESAGAHASCTGVVVAPRVVLTAAHCVEGLPPSAFEVFFGAHVGFAGSDGSFLGVSEVAVHPGYATDGRFDLALLRLVADAPVPAAPLATHLDDAAVGTTVRSVGFGQTSATGDTGDKRAGTLRIDMLDALDIHAAPGPSLTCKGDSGGPAFADGPSGLVVVGVTARGDAQCAAFSVLTRVDPFVATFIAPFAASVGPPAPIVTPGLAACSEPCATDASCPSPRVCVHAGRDDVPGHCAAPSLPAGAYDAPCARNGDCGVDACVAVPFAAPRSCFCYRPCDPAARCDAASVLPALTGACAIDPRPAPELAGGGCAVAAVSSSWPLMTLVIACALRLRRPSRGMGHGARGPARDARRRGPLRAWTSLHRERAHQLRRRDERRAGRDGGPRRSIARDRRGPFDHGVTTHFLVVASHMYPNWQLSAVGSHVVVQTLAALSHALPTAHELAEVQLIQHLPAVHA